MVLILGVAFASYVLLVLVSVPLRGLWFLSVTCSQQKEVATEKFPSPYGDYGSYQAFPNRHYVIIKGGFPSPYGDYGSYLL